MGFMGALRGAWSSTPSSPHPATTENENSSRHQSEPLYQTDDNKPNLTSLQNENFLLLQQIEEARRQNASLSEHLQAQTEAASYWNAYAKDVGMLADQEVKKNEHFRNLAMQLEAKADGLGKQNGDYVKELKQMQEKLDSTMADLRNAQLSTFKQAQTSWFVEEDTNAREALTQLYKDVRSWAKDHCLPSLANLGEYPATQVEPLHENLKKVSFFEPVESVFKIKHPFLILAALLSDHLSHSMFDNPFYMFQRPELLHRVSTASHLKKLFDRLCSGDTSGAHHWRAQLLRMVFPTTDATTDSVRPNSRVVRMSQLSDLYSTIASDFLNGPASLILQSLDDEGSQRRYKALYRLLARAGTVLVRLHTQRPGYEWLPSKDLLCQSFEVGSPFVAADRLHKLDDDEDDSCDSKKISIVISPLVRIWGDSNGENFDRSRVLVKAMVFLRD